MPLTVAVLDAGGHIVALKREDNSGILRPDIAPGKAWGRSARGSRAGWVHAGDGEALDAGLRPGSGRALAEPGAVEAPSGLDQG